MAARPFYDPVPDTFVVQSLVKALAKKKALRLARISDWLAGAIELAVAEKEIRKVQAEKFQTVYVRGVKIRKLRYHEGRPFLAPDGTPMLIQKKVMNGGQNLGQARWIITSNDDDPRSVKNCYDYSAWRDKILQSRDAMIAAGGSADNENGPPAVQPVSAKGENGENGPRAAQEPRLLKREDDEGDVDQLTKL